MKTLKCWLAICVTLVVATTLAEVNAWKPSVASGKWSEPGNWSLGHVPTAEEEVQFKEDCPSCTVEIDGTFTIAKFTALAVSGSVLTLTGTGTLAISGSEEYIRRETVVDGPALVFSGNLMTYSRVEVRSGSLTCATYMRYGGAYGLEVTGGSVTCTTGFQHRTYIAGEQSLVVSSGSFVAPNIYARNENVHGRFSFSFRVSGGVVQVGKLNLSTPGTFSQTGGELRLTNGKIDTEKVSVSLTGGTLKFVGNLTYGPESLYEVLHGELGTAPDVTEAYLCAPDGEFLVVTNSIAARGIGSAVASAAYVDVGALTFTGGRPFSSAEDASNVFNVYGPVVFRASADMAYDENDIDGVTVNMHGAVTVDTQDEADPFVSHAMYLSGLASPDGSAELIVRGGGTLWLRPADSWNPLRQVTVQAGASLALLDRSSEDRSWGPLATEKLVLGPAATLRLNANGNFVRLSACEIDPTARIVVAVPATFSGSTAWPIIQATGTTTLPAALADQVELVGAPEGTAVKCESGQLTVYLRGDDLGKWSDTGVYEWTGAVSGNNNWTEGGNWYGGNAPIEKTDVIYGSSASSVSTYNGLGEKGSTINKIVFKDNAIESFSVGGRQMTFAQASTAVSSYANVPQMVNIYLRMTAAKMGISAHGAAHLETGSDGFAFTKANGTLSLAGDVHLAGEGMRVPQINFAEPSMLQPMSRTTILAGAMLTVTNQTVDIAGTNTGFRVHEGGKLVFSGGDNARYCRNAASHLQKIDGTMEIHAPFVGGADQSFGGSGRLDILAGTRSGTENSRVLFADGLHVHLASWATVTPDADAAVAVSVAGSPTLHVAGDWSYGPDENATTSTTAADRAMVIQGGATLTVDVTGGTVRFVDPFIGDFATARRPSTLAVTNGTLNLDGSFETDVGVKVLSEGNLHVLADQTIGGFSAEAGSRVTFAASAALDVDGEVSLAGFSPVFEEADEAKSWRTVVRVTPGGLVSLPPEGGEFVFRAVETEGKISVQCRRRTGMVVSLR